MSAARSFRWRLLVGSAAWTAGALLVVSAILVGFLAVHPTIHSAMLGWFIAAPAALVIAIGLACMVAGALQIRRGLSAVDELRARLTDVRRGNAPHLSGRYPAEVQPLVDELNTLLADRAQRMARAVETAGDLAHGLKTPLAILARDAERAAASGDPALAGSMTDQIERMRRQIDYHLAGARAAAAAHTPGVTCALAPAVERLMRAMERLHAGRELRLERAVAPDHVVSCAPEDVEEMLGNLLDNACKWARGCVRVSATHEQDAVVMCVDDDGPGIEPAQTARVLERGVRADQRAPGSGLGLAIVRQLAELYGGAIVLGRSPLGGLRAQLRLPAGSGSAGLRARPLS